MTTHFEIPSSETVSPANQPLFDALKSKLGFVPNLYATLAHSENALGTYLALQSARTSLSAKAREVVNLAVSEANSCQYCLAAHTALGKMNGFSDDEILEIRRGSASFDPKLDALARLVRNIVETRGHADPALVNRFLAVGWTKENLVDTIVLIGDKTVTNYLHAVTGVPIDFPEAPKLAA